MIIYTERSTSTEPKTETHLERKRSFIRVVRQHVIRNDVYLTDSYYEEDASDNTYTPLFCIVRNMRGYAPVLTKETRPTYHPLSHVVVFTGSIMRNRKLFDLNDENREHYLFAMHNLPLEAYHMTQISLPKNAFQGERVNLIPHATDMFSCEDHDVQRYLKESIHFDYESYGDHGASLLYAQTHQPLGLDIWSIAHQVRSCPDIDTFWEDIHDYMETVDEMKMITNLHNLGFLDRILKEGIPNEPKHHLDGLYQYCLQGRYLVTQYINHSHNEFRHNILDILVTCVSFDNRGYDNIFDQFQDLNLEEDTVW